MNDRAEAEEHLRVIRTLMERATIYRAISAPTALVGGITAVVVAALSLIFSQKIAEISHFVLWWSLALCITLIANTLFIWRAAHKRSEPFISSSMKLALRALFPPCLVAVEMTYNGSYDYSIACSWVVCYGLGLLATAQFSPKSLVVLGWAFLLTGLAAWRAPMIMYVIDPNAKFISLPYWLPYFTAGLMGLTFGLFHLIYAAFTWPRKATGADA